MTKAQIQRDRKYKIWLFLAAYSVFVAVKLITDLAYFNVGRNPSAPSWPGRLGPVTNIALWCVCFVITTAISQRKFFQSKYVKFLFAGFVAWILWGAFANFSGLSFAGGWRGYRECIVIAVFTHTLYMSVKIIEIYDIKRQVIGVTIFILGAMLLYAFITYFNGFEFVNSLSNLFQKSGRYRYSYGFRHVNTSGRLCIMFFVFTKIYRVVSQEDKLMHKIRTGGGVYCPVSCCFYNSYLYSLTHFYFMLNSFLVRVFYHE